MRIEKKKDCLEFRVHKSKICINEEIAFIRLDKHDAEIIKDQLEVELMHMNDEPMTQADINYMDAFDEIHNTHT